MRMRRLGDKGPEVSAIGLGCMGMSWAYGTPDDEGSARTLRRALDLGVTLFDTAVAAEIGATPAQAALAWLLAQDERVIPIPGTKRVSYLEQNTAAADLTLTPEQLAALSAAVPAEAVSGDRYAPRGMTLLDR
jgi:aryl-alcohol dehydrogenase-like predicted oxidoreductase